MMLSYLVTVEKKESERILKICEGAPNKSSPQIIKSMMGLAR